MDRKNSWWMLGLVGVLVALLPVLAFLQYQWIGAVSDGEKTRMKQTLNAGVMRFVDDINRPLERAHNTFLMGQHRQQRHQHTDQPQHPPGIFPVHHRPSGLLVAPQRRALRFPSSEN